jgi:hypothetical protein
MAVVRGVSTSRPKSERTRGGATPITVAGFTIASASAHCDQTLETTTQKARSIGRSGGRGAGPLENGELLPEHEDLDDEACAQAQCVDERVEQGRDDCEHHRRR